MPIFELLYLFCAIWLAAYGFNSIVHTWLFWRHRKSESRADSNGEQVFMDGEEAGWQNGEQNAPKVTIQLPIYNERYVAKRLIEAVMALEWPADALQIQVLDDSTDDTTQIIEAVLARYHDQSTVLEHIRRPDRSGYKAGALQYGLATATGEFIAIFDADFVPPPNFLYKTIPYFADARVGCVQSRWGHVNPQSSRLTQAQALGIDGHFCIEQFARDRIGAFLNFNGTAGVWRRSCMESAGGWEGDTLTEDLDLSYRAQLSGWRVTYRPDLVVPAELPVQIDAFKRQQFRWAKGSIQTAMKLLGRLWRAEEPAWRKVLGTLHLTNYLVHPLMVINLLLLFPLSFSNSPLLHIAPFLTSAAIGPPLMYWSAMTIRNESFWTRLRQLAILMALGTGLSINNSKAAWEAVTGITSEFKRTPKFAVTAQQAEWHTSTYVLPRNPIVWIELMLAFYAAGLLIYCFFMGVWWILFWVLLYAGGYGYIAWLAFVQAWQLKTKQTELALSREGMP